MSSINFCLENMGTQITCDKVYRDGYGPENLLKKQEISGFRQSNAGFLVESYIRPPVNLTLHFPCNIDIQRIIVCGKVGMQKSCAVEILVANDSVNKAVLHDNTESLKHYARGLKFRSAGVLYADQKQHIFAFHNYNFKARQCLGDVSRADRQLSSDVCTQRSLLGRVSAVSHATIRIKRAMQACTVAVGWLEVWGQPARNCTPDITKHIFSLHSSMFATPETSKAKNSSDESLHTPTLTTSLKQDADIPADFLDSLTQDLMCLPVLLPSSHNIDQTSLDRHNHQEAVWGRAPSDPFTGLPYTDKRKPLPNTTLKLRIDQFLLKHREIPGPRRLGSLSKQSHASSRLVMANDTTHPVTTETTTSQPNNIDGGYVCASNAQDKTSNTKITKSLNSFACKRKLDESQKQSTSKKTVVTDSNKHASQKVSRSVKSKSQAVVIDLCDDDNQDMQSDAAVLHALTSDMHSSNKHSSVDNALENALDGLPSYIHSRKTSSLTPESSHKSSDQSLCCVGCKLGISQALYKGPCNHVLCRNCITRSTNIGHVTCPNCQAKYVTREYTKMHQRSSVYH